MDLGAVMDEIGDKAESIAGLRVFRYPAENIHPPALVVALPEEIDYVGSYQRGMDRMQLDVVVMVGKANDRTSVATMAEYASGSGERSIKAALDSTPGGVVYTSCDEVTVNRADFDVFTMGGVQYLAAVFEVDVVGSGSN